jgi:hypothetical protein
MKHKEEEYSQIKKETSELLRKFPLPEEEKLKDEDPRFIMIPQREALLKKIGYELESTRYRAEIVTTADRLPQLLHCFFEPYKRCVERGVKLRLITDEFEEENSVAEMAHVLMENSRFQMRVAFISQTPNFVVFDRKKAILTVDPTRRLAESPAIWTNHSGFIELLEEHFEKIWSQSKKPKLKEHFENSLTATE